MESFVVVLHVLVAIVLISLVLVQDSKGGGALGIGGSGSNSLLGATGAQTLAAKLTRIAAIIFAGTCLTLTWFVGTKQKSVIDSLPAAAAPAPTNPTQATPTLPATAPQAETAKAQTAGEAQSPNKPQAPSDTQAPSESKAPKTKDQTTK